MLPPVDATPEELAKSMFPPNPTETPDDSSPPPPPPYDCSDNKNMLYGAQDGRCNGCKHRFPKRNLTFDHIVPRSAGGGDNIENLQLLCAACNSVKGKRGMAYLRSVLDLDDPKPKRKPRKPSKKAKKPKKPE